MRVILKSVSIEQDQRILSDFRLDSNSNYYHILFYVLIADVWKFAHYCLLSLVLEEQY